MPVIFYVLLLMSFVIALRPNRERSILDKNSCNVIKGFFILLIIFSHILNAFPYDGVMSHPLHIFRVILGQLCVSMFFFISGYGIIFSIETKGNNYSKTIFTNRVLRILLYTLLGLIPYFIYSSLSGKVHSLGDYFLSLIGLSSFGNSAWFIFAILICYLICAIVYIFNWKNVYIPAVLISAGVVGYVLIMFFLNQPYYTWDTIICFVYGVIAGLFRKKIYFLLEKKKFTAHVLMITSIGVVILLQHITNSKYGVYFPEIAEHWFANLFLCLFFISLTKIFVLKSPFLSFLGNASFALYIMHELIICCFVDYSPTQNPSLNYLILFIAAPMIGIPFYYLYKEVDRWVINPIVSWNRKQITKK